LARHRIAGLALAGLRVVAPDQRGYNLSWDQPAGIAAYRFDALAEDTIELAAAFGRQRLAVVGTIGAEPSPGPGGPLRLDGRAPRSGRVRVPLRVDQRIAA
jgi:hypothetical protein